MKHQKLVLTLLIQFITTMVLSTFVPSPVVAQTTKRGYVSFTFDDGYASTHKQAFPILQKYNVRGTAYVTKSNTGDTGYMTWNQIKALQTAGWEIGSHSLTHREIPTLADNAVQQEIAGSKTFLEGKGLTINTFAFPYGAYDMRSLVHVNRHYNAARGFWDRDNLNAWPYAFYVLQVKSIERGVSVQQVQAWIDEAHATNAWLILVYHDLQTDFQANNEYVTRISDLEEHVSYAVNKGTSVLPVQQVLETTKLTPQWSDAFNQGVQKWPDMVGSVIDTKNNGQYPEPKNSLKIATTAKKRNAYVRSEAIAFAPTSTHQIAFFANTIGIKGASMGVYMDEYDEQGNWISGQIVGTVAQNYVGTKSFSYTPSSNAVKSTRIQFYLDGDGKANTAFIDNVSVYQK